MPPSRRATLSSHKPHPDTPSDYRPHACPPRHSRDLLREDSTIRKQYQDLKLQLEANNRGGIAEYLAQKAPYIDALMDVHLRD
ncbi:GrpB family protein [Pseudomonas sp. UBA6310]|uniref:GrpB family protein n=1 Tax=Pseudomonas sp. UBA6310 TaxID=1947327 RepID=UPI0039C8CEDA